MVSLNVITNINAYTMLRSRGREVISEKRIAMYIYSTIVNRRCKPRFSDQKNVNIVVITVMINIKYFI